MGGGGWGWVTGCGLLGVDLSVDMGVGYWVWVTGCGLLGVDLGVDQGEEKKVKVRLWV